MHKRQWLMNKPIVHPRNIKTKQLAASVGYFQRGISNGVFPTGYFQRGIFGTISGTISHFGYFSVLHGNTRGI
jgi:hypothetical protein